MYEILTGMGVQREDENVAYVSNFNSADHVTVNLPPFMGDLPPPYSPPKLPAFEEGEPPPPYKAVEDPTDGPSLVSISQSLF